MPGNVNIFFPKVSLALIHWNTFKFVYEVGARAYEKVALLNPDI